jgi:hypothetical protein
VFQSSSWLGLRSMPQFYSFLFHHHVAHYYKSYLPLPTLHLLSLLPLTRYLSSLYFLLLRYSLRCDCALQPSLYCMLDCISSLMDLLLLIPYVFPLSFVLLELSTAWEIPSLSILLPLALCTTSFLTTLSLNIFWLESTCGVLKH